MKKIVLLLAISIILLNSSVKTVAQTTGTLTFTYTPIAHASGNFNADKRYVLAIYIMYGSTLIKTTNRYCEAAYYDKLSSWASYAGCGFSGTPLTPDATSSFCETTGAILGGAQTNYAPRTVIWDGIDKNGNLAQDGNFYNIRLEETWGSSPASHAISLFNFAKDPNVDDQTTGIPNDANFKDISLIWQPTLSTANFAAATATVFPNPSNTGVFNLAVKDSVTAVKVYSILGEILSNETVSLSNGDTKILDLSSYNNGLYIVSVTNNKGTANYKVVLDK